MKSRLLAVLLACGMSLREALPVVNRAGGIVVGKFGAANLGSGLSGGMVVNGSLSKTAVNAGAGAKSQLSSLVVAVLTVVTLLFLTGLFEDLPEAVLAAVVIAAVIELVDIPSLVRLYRVYSRGLGSIYGFAARPDFIAAMADVEAANASGEVQVAVAIDVFEPGTFRLGNIDRRAVRKTAGHGFRAALR